MKKQTVLLELTYQQVVALVRQLPGKKRRLLIDELRKKRKEKKAKTPDADEPSIPQESTIE